MHSCLLIGALDNLHLSTSPNELVGTSDGIADLIMVNKSTELQRAITKSHF